MFTFVFTSSRVHLPHLLHDHLVGRSYGLQVVVQSEAETPHPAVEEEAHGHDDCCRDVHPLVLEGPRMGLDGEDGVAVEGREDDAVARVAQVFDDLLHLLADALYLVVGLVVEERLDHVGRRLESVLALVFGYLAVHACEALGVGRVVGRLDDDLLAADVALLPEAQQPHEEAAVGVEVEDRGVFVGLVGDKQGRRYQHGGREPLAKPYRPRSLARHAVARVVEDVEDDIDHDSHDDGDAQSALADDGSQGRADEEEDDAYQGERELVDILYLVLAYVFVQVARDHALELQVGQFGLHGAQRPVHAHAAGVLALACEERVEVHCLGCRLPSRHLQQVGCEGTSLVVEVVGVAEVHLADAVAREVERVDVGLYLPQVLRARVACQPCRVGQAEIAVEVHDEAFVDERLAAVGHGCASRELLGPHVLKPLSAIEVHHEVLLLGSRLEHAGVGQDDGLVLVRLGHAVDHDVVEFARLQVFLSHVDVGLGDAVVEDALWYLQLRTFLLHRQHELGELQLGVGGDVVLEIERDEGDADAHDDQSAHRLEQGDACRLDGCQLAALAQVAVGDERTEQDGQGEGLRHHDQGHVPEKLRQHINGETLADKRIDIAPQKLHHQHEEADEERAGKQLAELAGDE